jgi:hypothetical protein
MLYDENKRFVKIDDGFYYEVVEIDNMYEAHFTTIIQSP